MDIPAVFSNKSDASDDTKIKPTDGDNVTMVPSGRTLHDSDTLDPLASFGIGANFGNSNKVNKFKEELVKNNTISTSDKSGVGDFRKIMEQFPSPEPSPEPVTSEPETEPSPEPSPEPEPTATPVAAVTPEPIDPTLDITDPTKMDFVKTYTSEFDAVTERAMTAVRAVLSAIDDTVRNHTNDINIDQSVNEFIENPPKDGKVDKFEDAQDIVRQIMKKAEDSKTQSEQAAREAAKIYDDIQKFKKDTEDEIDSIKARDEFGRTGDQRGVPSSDLDAIKKFMH